jgi:hypothetical protein
MLIWQDSDGTHVGYLDPHELADRYALDGHQQTLERQSAMLTKLAAAAARSSAPPPDPILAYFNEVDRGGHFTAWEQPQIFTGEGAATAAPGDWTSGHPSSGRRQPFSSAACRTPARPRALAL